MKKLIFILSLVSFSSFSQEAKRLKIFKFHPFSLITGSLNVSQETFNKESTKSFIVGLGVRYLNRKEQVSFQNGTVNEVIPQFNKWQGATLSLERRLYVPGFFGGDKYSFISEKGQFGIYFSGGSKFEYNVNQFDNSRVGYVIDPKNNSNLQTKVIDQSKTQYLGIMPNINMGMQFTLFQNLYTDIHIGGAIRFLSSKVLESNKSNTQDQNYYYGNTLKREAINTFVIKEGVQANFGFALGLRL
jgi:hypothetical protein